MPLGGENDVRIVIRVDDSDSTRKLDRLEQALDNLSNSVSSELNRNFKQSTKELDRLGETASRTGTGFTRFQANIIALNQGIELLGGVLRTATGLFSSLFDSLGEAQKIEGLARSFENLQSSIGSVGSESLQGLRNATKGLVSDLQLFEAANNAVLLGVDDGTGKFNQLAEAALKLGQAAGRTATEALNDITVGIGRQSRLILDNLGIVVDAEKAYANYAATLRKSADALTDAEKKTAFLNETLAQAQEKASQTADVQETAGVATLRLGAAITNLNSEFVTSISQSQVLGSAIRELADAINTTDAQTLATGIAQAAAAFINFAANITRGAIPALEDFTNRALVTIETLNQIASGNFSNPLEAAQFQVFSDAATAATQDVISSFERLQQRLNGELSIQDLPALEADLDRLEQNFDNLDFKNPELGAGIRELRKEFEELAQFIDSGDNGKAYQARLESLKKALASNGDETKKLRREQEKLEAQQQRLNDTFAEAIDALDPRDVVGPLTKLQSKIQDIVTAAENGADNIPELTDELRKLATAANVSQDDLDAIQDAIKKIGDASEKAEDSIEQLGNTLADGLGLSGTAFGGILNNLESIFNTEIGQTIGQNITSGIADAIRTGDIQGAFSDASTSIGSALGAGAGKAFGGPFGEAIGAALGEEFGARIGEIGTSTRNTLQGIDALLPTFTFGLGDAIANIFSKRNDPFRDARKGLKEFLKEVDEAAGTSFFSDFRIEGFQDVVKSAQEVKEIFGDTFGDFTTQLEDGSFLVNEFSAELGELGLTANRELLGTFEGIGTAIASAFEDSEGLIQGFGQSFGTLLGVNLQDELGLNQLQLALQQAGFSAEEFSQTLQDAFFTGEISASQFLNSQAATEDLFAQGIPGAVGATDAAFANLVTGGLQSGQQALDALGDIGAEALELNIQSTAELGQQLIAAGADAEQVGQLMQALATQGIETTEALANIDLTQAANIITNLESIGFGFTEVSDQITTARDLLEQFREEASKPIDARINVRVNVDDPDGGLSALENSGGPAFNGQSINS